jgi:hypothetical protein
VHEDELQGLRDVQGLFRTQLIRQEQLVLGEQNAVEMLGGGHGCYNSWVVKFFDGEAWHDDWTHRSCIGDE